MAAFAKVRSGVSGIDRAIDWIRIGDNVVWQVDSVDAYRPLARAFAAASIADGRTLLYIRFAPHAPIFAPDEEFPSPNGSCRPTIMELDPTQGFERFTGDVHRIAERAGPEAFYVFDSLSELETAWAADLMMGNFFSVTCPYLFELDTVAWFCILRHRHSYDAVARVRETTQILIDLFSDGDDLYIHPIKVWKRYSPTMFFPQRLSLAKPDEAFPVTDGVSVSKFYRLAGVPGDQGGPRNLDSWERFFLDARDRVAKDPSSADALLPPMAERLFGPDRRFLELALRHCEAGDLFEIKDRMIGSGKIGGKAVGMVLARKIVSRSLPDVAGRIEPHDSFFVGSDVFYTYLVHNKLWRQRIAQRTDEGYFAEAPALAAGIRGGSFPERVREQFARLLDHFGQSPIIVRSSSLLEDSFGHAFAGKYESVFCANTGSPEERVEAFEAAMKTVYASTMDASALEYRRQRGLSDQDEQMAILVQRVSGSLYGSFFMPAAAGVGYSLNAWKWHPDINPEAGMLRLVVGLGTRAVDRTSSDYPRLVSLDMPGVRPSSGEDAARYCQRSVDVVDLSAGMLQERTLSEILPHLPAWLVGILAERDYETERSLAETGNPAGEGGRVFIGTCEGVVSQTRLLGDMRSILGTLQEAYAIPVDVEFTFNWSSTDEYLINVLQCRPLQTVRSSDTDAEPSPLDPASAAALSDDRVLFSVTRDAMGPRADRRVDAVVVVDPAAYYETPYRDKPSVARALGEINARYRGSGKFVILLTPGRIGTSSPELGVPVSFAEIDAMGTLCEVAFSEAGYAPELSFGSHFFQDLVESGIGYAAIPEGGDARYRPDLLTSFDDRFAQMVPSSSLPPGLIRVCEPEGLRLVSDAVRGSCHCFFDEGD